MAQSLRKVPWKLGSWTGSPVCQVFTPPQSSVRPTRTPEKRWSGSPVPKCNTNLSGTPRKSPRTRLFSLLNSSTESNIQNEAITLNSPATTSSNKKKQAPTSIKDHATLYEKQRFCDNRFLTNSDKTHKFQRCVTNNISTNTRDFTSKRAAKNAGAARQSSEYRLASPVCAFLSPQQQYSSKKKRLDDKESDIETPISSRLPPSTPQTFAPRKSLKISDITLTPTHVSETRGRLCSKLSEGSDGVFFDTPFREELVKRGLDGLDFKPHILGRGGFGVVVSALYGGNQVAVKLITKNSRRRRSIEISIQNEENALDLVHHPNIVEAYGVYDLGQDYTIVVMEYAGSVHLVKILEDPKEVIDSKRRLNLTYQIATAIQWCHQHNILHLDVKPANVMVNDNDLCKLGDFGCSSRLDEMINREDFHMLGGTVAYRAPELLQGNIPTFKADIYSLGITMWQLVSRQMPYNGLDPHVIIYKVVSCNARPESPKVVSDVDMKKYIDLYETLWVLKDSNRLGVDGVCHRLQQLRSDLF